MNFICQKHQQIIMASQISASAYLDSSFEQGKLALQQQDLTLALKYYGSGFDIAMAMLCDDHCRAYHHELPEQAFNACQQVCHILSLMGKWEHAEICAGRLHMRLLDCVADEMVESQFRAQCTPLLESTLAHLLMFLDIVGRSQHAASISRFTMMSKRKAQLRLFH